MHSYCVNELFEVFFGLLTVIMCVCVCVCVGVHTCVRLLPDQVLHFLNVNTTILNDCVRIQR
jgi:hypothetical protein